MPETRSTPVDDEAAEHIAQWSRLPHPLEAAVLHEVNDNDASVNRAAEIMHRRPPGLSGPTRSVWVLTKCAPTGEGTRREVASWCWYATRTAAEAATKAATNATKATDGTIVLHETSVPRAVRCEGVEAYLGQHYHARSAQPAQ